MISDAEHFFMYPLVICMSLEKCLFGSFPHFEWDYLFALSCISYFYIADVNPLSDIWLAIFSPIPYVASSFFFFFFLVSFAMKSFFSLIQFYLFSFAFVAFTCGVISK